MYATHVNETTPRSRSSLDGPGKVHGRTTMKNLPFRRIALRASAAAVVAFAFSTQASAGLVDGSFEGYGIAAGTFGFRTDTSFAGWRTTATDHQLEIWGTGFNGVPSYSGRNFAELNANQVSTLYQDVSPIAAGSLLDFHFAHRGRQGVDVMRLTITDYGIDNAFGTADDVVLFTRTYSDGNTAWGFYTNPAPIVALGHAIRFAYQSVSATGSNPAIGNFLDAADFGVGVNAVPEPSTFALVALGLAGVGFYRSRRVQRT